MMINMMIIQNSKKNTKSVIANHTALSEFLALNIECNIVKKTALYRISTKRGLTVLEWYVYAMVGTYYILI